MILVLQSELLRSPHLPEEMIGNLLLVDMITLQQSRPMVVFGFGALMIVEILEQTMLHTDILQLLHLPAGLIGNLLVWEEELREQSRQMVVCGLGDLRGMGNVEIVLLGFLLQ